MGSHWQPNSLLSSVVSKLEEKGRATRNWNWRRQKIGKLQIGRDTKNDKTVEQKLAYSELSFTVGLFPTNLNVSTGQLVDKGMALASRKLLSWRGRELWFDKTQCQLCKGLAGPFIPLSWSCLVWRRILLWMWSLGGRQQPFSCVLGHFQHGDERTNERTTGWP